MMLEFYKDTLPVNKQMEIDNKLSMIDDNFMKNAANEFVEQMFGNESKLSKEVFILKLTNPQFKWVLDSQACREKVDEWLKMK